MSSSSLSLVLSLHIGTTISGNYGMKSLCVVGRVREKGTGYWRMKTSMGDIPFRQGAGEVGMQMYRDVGSDGHSCILSVVSSRFATEPGVFQPGPSMVYNPPNNPFSSPSQPSTPTTHSSPSPIRYTHSTHSPTFTNTFILPHMCFQVQIDFLRGGCLAFTWGGK